MNGLVSPFGRPSQPSLLVSLPFESLCLPAEIISYFYFCPNLTAKTCGMVHHSHRVSGTGNAPLLDG